MNRNKVTELLSNYRMYRFAIRNFESTGWVAMTGTAYSDMPKSGAFGSRAPVKFAVDSLDDVSDYNAYKRAVQDVDDAMMELADEEQSVVKLKWMEGMTLQAIADRKCYSLPTVKRWHKRALTKLAIGLRFVEVPEIENVPAA